MAGPGGGAPRRSHTKSRKGCKTCKKRHIRCDENFPQCRNCTKHNCRCSYMDGPQPEERSSASPPAPDLLWNSDSEQDIERWKTTGELPWPEMQFRPRVPLSDFSTTELRLIHHIASVSAQMQRSDASRFTIWTYQVPKFLKLASSDDFVLHSVLALSATHLAWITECETTLQIACHHRGIAFSGLQEAIGMFSRQNSDAVLAASIMLSLQVTDWRAWRSLLLGTSSVVDAMRQWRNESHFPEYMDERSTFARVPAASPAADGQRLPEASRRDQAALQRIALSLQSVEAHAACRSGETRGLRDLVAFVRKLPTCATLRSPAQQFEFLQPLRSWLLWRPLTLHDYGARDPGEMIVLAHLYAVALLVERLFPAVGAAGFGTMSIPPTEEIAGALSEMQATGPVHPSFPNPLALIEVPLQVISASRPSLGQTQESNGLYSPIVVDPHRHGLGRLTLDPEVAELSERASSARSVSYSSDGGPRSTASPMLPEMAHHGQMPHPPQVYYGSPLAGPVDPYGASNHPPQHPSFSNMGWMGTPTSSVEADAEHRYKVTTMDYNEGLVPTNQWHPL